MLKVAIPFTSVEDAIMRKGYEGSDLSRFYDDLVAEYPTSEQAISPN